MIRAITAHVDVLGIGVIALQARLLVVQPVTLFECTFGLTSTFVDEVSLSAHFDDGGESVPQGSGLESQVMFVQFDCVTYEDCGMFAGQQHPTE
nr:hypothetical protein CFP56_54921 [Quercus suber]